MPKTIPKVSEAELETINDILRKGGSVEIRRRRDAVVILDVRGKVIREIRAVPEAGQEPERT